MIARQYAGKPAAVDLKGYDPMAAFTALGGGNAWGNPRSDILQFLQLGNEIGAEQGQGRDAQVMQLIAALLGGQQPGMR